MLFSNALFIAIASTLVSANVEIQLPENWVAAEKREEAPRLDKLFARLAKRGAQAQDSTKVPPGVTYTYKDRTTTVTITGGVTPKPTTKPTTTAKPTTTKPTTTATPSPTTTSSLVVKSSSTTTSSLVVKSSSTTTPSLIVESSSTPASITSVSSSSSTNPGEDYQTTTEVIATSCDDFGSCTTTTFYMGYNTN